MIDDHEAEQSGTGERRGATGDPGAPVSSADLPPYDDLPPPDAGMHPDDLWAADDGSLLDDGPPPDELEKAEDLGLGEAELALLEWAMRQRQSVADEPLLPSAEAAPEARPEPLPDWVPPPEPREAPKPEAAASAERPDAEPRSPWDFFHGSAEEAISALVAAGGPDPRDFASPRLTRRAKTVIAIALVVLFVVSALGGFVGYRITHRAAGAATEAVGRLVEVRGGAV
jgi:hypothetical protein